MRELSLVFVTDQEGHIKWSDRRDFHRQHDPDFEPSGEIVVFDNRDDDTTLGKGAPRGSLIEAIDPATNEVRNLYPELPRFYTVGGGKHQLLANGNRLITEAMPGRAFEVTPAGKIVWEYVNDPWPQDKNYRPELMEATRYALDAKQVAAWPCAEPQ